MQEPLLPLGQSKAASGKGTDLTFSGLLNAMDGVASTEGRLIVMTTNHIERLDSALIRPGRADVRLYFGNATASQARRLFDRFFPQAAALADEFAERIEQRRFSMAALQDYLMLHRRDAHAGVRHVADIGCLETLAAPAGPTTTIAESAAPRPRHAAVAR